MSKVNKKAMIEAYSSNNIIAIKNDIDKLKERPTQYIGYDGWEGFFHITKEVIQNSIDESTIDDALCDKIVVIYDEIDKRVTVLDNGRGIPPDSVIDACTVIQSSGKFDLSSYSNNTSGENGVGITATNALSKEFTVVTYRGGNDKHTFSFKEGVLIDRKKEKSEEPGRHGTIVSFIPNEEILGKCNMSYKNILNWLSIIQYSCRNLELNLIVSGSKNINKTFISKQGLYDLYKSDKDIKGNILFEPIHFEAEGVINSDKYKRSKKTNGNSLKFKIEVLFGYDKTTNAENINSFCNYVHTIENGTHVTGARQGIGEYLLSLVKDKLSKKDLEKLDINIDDARNGLYLIVNLSTKEPQFVGQNKEKVGNKDLANPIAKLVSDNLKEIIGKDKKLVDIIVKYIKGCAEQRIKSRKVKELALKEITSSTSNFDLPDNLSPISDKYKEFEGRYELFIVEGDSAGSHAGDGVDSRFQAIYPIKGVPPNGFKLSLIQALGKVVFRDIFTVLGCGYGETFNIKKLKYSKIIIMTDADSDGDKIAPLLCSSFLKHAPELITGGHLYRVFAPLLEVSYGDKKMYLKDKAEYANLMLESVGEEVSIYRDGVKLLKDEVRKLIYLNIDYLYELGRFEFDQSANPDILEVIVAHIAMKSNIKEMRKDLEKRFKELNVDISDPSAIKIEGPYKGDWQFIVVNDIFLMSCEPFRKIIEEVNDCNIFYKYKDKNVTLGKILRDMESKGPKILDRFKGLGQMDYQDLRDTTLIGSKKCPRQLVRMTVEDVEETIEKFQVIHGNGTDSLMAARKKLMENFILKRDDIDN